MDISRSDPHTPPSWKRPTSACLSALGLVLLSLVVIGVATAIRHHVHPPTCYGIGFGCTPDAFTTAALLGMMFGAPLVAVAWLVITIGWASTRQQADQVNLRATWWPVWGLGGGLAVIVVLAVAFVV